MKLNQLLAERIKNAIYSSIFKEMARKRPEDFTRDRKMPFEELIIFMITSLKCSTASALRRFFVSLGLSIYISQQSVSEARAKVKVEAFVHLCEVSAATMTEYSSKNWHGYRVYGIDGSKIALPTDKNLISHLYFNLNE